MAALRLRLLIILALSFGALLFQPARCSDFTDSPFMRKMDRDPTERKEPSLEDLFVKKQITYASVDPVDLSFAKIPGLNDIAMKILSDNLFVIVDNTKYNTMAELYRDNRLRGKSNFVTLDAMVHPYLAHKNALLAGMLNDSLIPDLSTLLSSMILVSNDDYLQAGDADVREDIQRNTAFVAVGLKLLNPSASMSLSAPVKAMVDQEFQNIRNAKLAQSAIFDTVEDYSKYHPVGWYTSTAKLRNFYRCKQYLSRFNFPLSDGKGESTSDPFRRSTLLFRSLDKPQKGSQRGIVLWQSIYAGWLLLGDQPYSPERSMLPSAYRDIFNSPSENLKVTLTKLAEPFFRTKLLLSVKKRQPLQFSSTSIFDISTSKSTQETKVSFRLFPVIEEPEAMWLNCEAQAYSKEDPQAFSPPLALLDLHGHGVTQATNVLADSIWRLDPSLLTTIPTLVQTIKRAPQPQTPPILEVLAPYFKLPAQTANVVLRTNLWMTHKLATGFAAWLDDQLTVLPVEAHEPDSETPKVQTPAAATATPAVKPASFHYLEPCSETYRAMRTALQALTDKLTAASYFPRKLTQQNDEMLKLMQHLTSISDRELSGQQMLFPADSVFLGNIDLLLDKISPPSSNTMFFDLPKNPDSTDVKGTAITGATMCLGKPGLAFVIFQKGRNITVGRGAIYTYYELPGGPMTAQHFDRKLEYGLLKAPFWTSQFEVLQELPIGGMDAIK